MPIVKSVIKGLKILEFIADSPSPPTPVQIAKALGMNRTTVYHLSQTLESEGYVTKEKQTNAYLLGLKNLPLGKKALDSNKLRIESLPYLQGLNRKLEERINLGILYDSEVLFLAGIEKPSLPLMYSHFGKKAPAHCCSIGKIILAYLPEHEVERVINQKPLVRFTENTITDLSRFKRHLSEIRSQGYAIDNAEHISGEYCIAALIKGEEGRGIGAISASSDDLGKISQHLDDLFETAEIISHLMGFRVR
jgi:IclR family acetate operon transcriptional repressor